MVDPKDFIPDLVKWEGNVDHMYRDTVGYCTVAVGHLLHNAEDATALAFCRGGQPASNGDIEAEFNEVMRMPKGLGASAYFTERGLYLPLDVGEALAANRLSEEFLPALRGMVTGFDGLPRPWQTGLVDMAWNLGVHGLGGGFPNFLAALNRGAGARAAVECHRATCRDDRNDWCRDLFAGVA